MNNTIALKLAWNKLRLYFSFLLLAFYLVIAFLFLFTDTWADFFPQGRVIIGLALLLFGSLRFYVAYRRYKNKNMQLEELKKAVDQADPHTSTPFSMGGLVEAE